MHIHFTEKIKTNQFTFKRIKTYRNQKLNIYQYEKKYKNEEISN